MACKYHKSGICNDYCNAKGKEEKVTYEEVTYTRKKQIGKRADDISKLPVETIEYELPESERICPECGGELHSMSVDERCEIEIIPPQYIAKHHLQHIYACRNCAG